MMELREALKDFLSRYEERGYIVLRAIAEEYRSRLAGGPKLGDFDVRGVKSRIRSYGVDYNPVPLLAKLEKEVGLIDTTYRSYSRRWWRIRDPAALEEVLREYEGRPSMGEEAWEARLLRIQFYSLEPGRLLEYSRRLSRAGRLAEHQRRLLRRLAFEELPLLVRFVEEAQEKYPEELEAEIETAKRIIESIERALLKALGEGWRGSLSAREIEQDLGP